jgi:O-antigen ligase
MQAGWKMFLAAPFGGLGAGTFALAYPSYAPIEAIDNASAMAAHNSFVQVLAEDGLFGLAAFMAALAAAFAYTRRAMRASPHDAPNGGPDHEREQERDHEHARTAAGATQGALLAFVLSSLTGGIALSWPIYFALGVAAALPRLRELHSNREAAFG